MRCGLLGEVLGHSYSPDDPCACWDNYSYDLFQTEPEELDALPDAATHLTG